VPNFYDIHLLGRLDFSFHTQLLLALHGELLIQRDLGLHFNGITNVIIGKFQRDISLRY